MKNYTQSILIIITGVIIYVFFFHKTTIAAYCKHKLDIKRSDFSQSVRKNSSDPALEENEEIRRYLGAMFDECLEGYGFK